MKSEKTVISDEDKKQDGAEKSEKVKEDDKKDEEKSVKSDAA